MENGIISEVKELKQEGYSASVTWVFGALLFVGLVNLVCCTPVYLMVIGYLYAKAMGQ